MKTISNDISAKFSACLVGLIALLCMNTIQASVLVQTGRCKFFDLNEAKNKKIELQTVDFGSLDTIFSYNLYGDGVVLWSNTDPETSHYMYYDSSITKTLDKQELVVMGNKLDLHYNLTGMGFEGELKDHKGCPKYTKWELELTKNILKNFSTGESTRPGKPEVVAGTLKRPATSMWSEKPSITGRTVTKGVACIIYSDSTGTLLRSSKFSEVTIRDGTKKTVILPNGDTAVEAPHVGSGSTLETTAKECKNGDD